MKKSKESQPSVSNRRHSVRVDVEAVSSIQLITNDLVGVSQNKSDDGLFMVTSEPASVLVHVQIDGRPQIYSGKVVRCQRMPDGTCSWAIEFDERDDSQASA